MPMYKVNADRHQVIKRDKQNRVVSVERLGRGDTVEMSEAEALPLIKAGGLVLATEDTTTPEEVTTPTPQQPAGSPGSTPAALSGQTADEGLRPATEIAEDDLQEIPEDEESPNADSGAVEKAADALGEEDEDDEEPTPDDGYETLSYSALQAEAKKRGLNGGGSSQDLIARLREDDQS